MLYYRRGTEISDEEDYGEDEENPNSDEESKREEANKSEFVVVDEYDSADAII